MAYELVKRTGYYGFGGVLDDVLTKVQGNPQEIAARAQQLAQQAVGAARDQLSQIKQNAFKYFYTQSRGLIDLVNADPRVKAFTTGANALYDTIDKLRESKFEMDAGGVVDLAMGAQTVVDSVSSFAKAVGANSKVVETVGSWASIGLGCMAGMSAGGLAGVVSCGLSVVGGIMTSGPVPGLYDKFAGPSHVPTGVPRALLTPVVTNQPWIQTDAVRLATLLKYYYSIPSVGTLWTTIDAQNLGLLEYPKAPAIDPVTNQVVGSVSSPIPAFTLWEIADALGGRGSAINAAQAVREPFEEALNRQIRGYGFSDYHDANVATVETAAAMARALVAGCGIAGWPLTNQNGGLGTRQLDGFVAVDELINYFAAVTLFELDDFRRTDVAKVELAYLRYGLPVRLLSTETTRHPNGYSDNCWTSLTTGGTKCDAGALEDAVRARDVHALKEFGSLRLMAAFAQLINLYKWSSPESRADYIAATVVPPTNDIRFLLQAPVDPRQILPTGQGRWVLRDGEDVPVDGVPVSLAWNGQPALHYFPPTAAGDFTGSEDIVLQARWVGQMRSANGWRLHAIHDPIWLYNALRSKEADLGTIRRKAREAAAADAATRGIKQLAIAAPVDQGRTFASQVMAPTVAQKSLQAGTAQLAADAVPAAVQRCLAAGGNPTFAYEGSYGGEHPVLLRGYSAGQLRLYLAGTDAKTLAKWGLGPNVPDVRVLNLYCLPQSNLGPIALLAGVALLAAKFMK